jgi:chromosome segregation ATPase
MTSMKDRLKAATELSEKLQSKVQRISGLKEAAENNLSEVEEEIRSNNLDPDTLPETLDKLREALEASLEKFEADLASAQEALSKFEDR